MLVEYYLEAADAMPHVGATSRWLPRHPGGLPFAIHHMCTACGSQYGLVLPLSVPNPHHHFSHGLCPGCFRAGRTGPLGRYSCPGSLLSAIDYTNEHAYLDAFNLELLTREFLIRYDLYARTGNFARS